MVDKIGGLTVLPELAISQLSEDQNVKIHRFKKPFPSREISLIYYKPTYKQKILDELVHFIKNSLQNKLNYNKNPEDYINVKPQ
jgi:LysR family hydrogen peroxide-inducible transcriptional activator